MEQAAEVVSAGDGERAAGVLDGFFVSERGEFRLEPLPGGRTRLIDTTLYHHDLAPAAYWRWWTDGVIHRIHMRVLEQIARRSEAALP